MMKYRFPSKAALLVCGLAALAISAVVWGFGDFRGVMIRVPLPRTDFVFSGFVVDENQNPLTGVVASILKGQLVKMGAETKYDEEIRAVNGQFDFHIDGYSSVSVTFVKPGYIPAGLKGKAANSTRNSASLEQKQLRIVMRKSATTQSAKKETGT